jgi:hypothetical protein
MCVLTLCTGELLRLSLVSPDLPLAGHGVLQPGSLPPEFNAAFMYYCADAPLVPNYMSIKLQRMWWGRGRPS